MAQAARVTQDVFAGKAVNSNYYFQIAAGRSVPYMLKESVLSLRALDNIITQWQKEGYKYEMDYYLYKEFVGQSTIASDRAYLYQLLKDRFGFFSRSGWEQTPNYGSGGQINAFEISVPKNDPPRTQWVKPQQVVQAAYGPGPIRQDYPRNKKGKK